MNNAFGSNSRFNQFADLLCRLPSEVWINAIEWGPGWKWMHPLSKQWEFGPFSTLFLMLGINNFVTKGTADLGYWPKVVLLITQRPPNEPPLLAATLAPFYSTERLAVLKLRRLECFAKSDLARDLWLGNPRMVAEHFVPIWNRLAKTMGQKPSKKTIAFSMKCLAYALLMFDETDFDFRSVPVPVDSRVRALSRRLGCPPTNDEAERMRWSRALESIRLSNKNVTMLHLDSVLWQIGTLARLQAERHFVDLGAGKMASTIVELMGEATIEPSSSCAC